MSFPVWAAGRASEPCCLVSDSGQRAAAVERARGPVSVGLRLARVQQAQPQEAAVDRVPADRPEPARAPQRPRAAHHPRGRLGREREVRASHTPETPFKMSFKTGNKTNVMLLNICTKIMKKVTTQRNRSLSSVSNDSVKILNHINPVLFHT